MTADCQPDLGINTGDNYYENGISTLTLAERFEKSWRAVYQTPYPALQGLTWYGTNGNHDQIYDYKKVKTQHPECFPPEGEVWTRKQCLNATRCTSPLLQTTAVVRDKIGEQLWVLEQGENSQAFPAPGAQPGCPPLVELFFLDGNAFAYGSSTYYKDAAGDLNE